MNHLVFSLLIGLSVPCRLCGLCWRCTVEIDSCRKDDYSDKGNQGCQSETGMELNHRAFHYEFMTWIGFPHYWLFVVENPPVMSQFPDKGVFGFSLYNQVAAVCDDGEEEGEIWDGKKDRTTTTL